MINKKKNIIIIISSSHTLLLTWTTVTLLANCASLHPYYNQMKAISCDLRLFLRQLVYKLKVTAKATAPPRRWSNRF